MTDNLPKFETEDTSTNLLELAANNDIEAFRNTINQDPSIINNPQLWYSRQNSSSQMSLHKLTPLMIAATYGSTDVLKLILSRPQIDVNKISGGGAAALHFAASGGSAAAAETVRLLLSAGADPNLTDVNGRKPIDVISFPPKSGDYSTLRAMLLTEENISLLEEEKKEYSVDPLLMPDIKNGIYSTDEFRMFSFKIRPCSRAYSHDWTECPFVHPGENARRRDPRKFHYSCVPCPEFRRGSSCRRGDMCEYSHGVFECWLHPAQYRTRLCKDGTSCNRRVCFFAHKQDELRPLYVSSGVPSPCSIAATSLMMSPSNQNVPARLRSSLNARLFADIDSMNVNLPNRPFHPVTLMTPSNLDDMFLAESSSPRYSDVFSPMHQQQQGMLSPSGRMSPRHHHVDPMLPRYHHVDPVSPMSSRLAMLARQENHQFRSLSSRDLGSKWGPPEWAVAPDDELGKLKRSSSFEALDNGEEPDLSWVHSLVKETPQDVKGKTGQRSLGNEGENSNNYEIEQIDDQSVLGAWIEQMQLDQLMAQ